MDERLERDLWTRGVTALWVLNIIVGIVGFLVFKDRAPGPAMLCLMVALYLGLLFVSRIFKSSTEGDKK